VITLEPDNPHAIVIFGTGAGGDPQRYRPLLEDFAANGFLVLAPRFERFDVRTVTTEQLVERPQGMAAALEERAELDLPVLAVGHSVGAWAALCLAGAVPWGLDGNPIPVPTQPRVARLILFAPTVGWFRAPGALAHVRAPIKVFAGANDTVTPPTSALLLNQAPGEVDIEICPEVGHFDFMNSPPPDVPQQPEPRRAAFLAQLSVRTMAFAQERSSWLAPPG
jgi:pimeloyl-ACP methyl ester carboxylesterase